MALICSACSAENRDGANFCKHCGERLAPAPAPAMPPAPPAPADTRRDREWAATAPAQLRAPTLPNEFQDTIMLAPPPGDTMDGTVPPSDGDRTVLVGSGKAKKRTSSRASSTSSTSSASSSESADAPRSQPRRRRSPAAPRPVGKRGLWLWAGLLALGVAMVAAGWYGTSKTAPEPEPPSVVAGAPETAPVSPPVPVAPPEAPPAEAAAPEPPVTEAPPAAPPPDAAADAPAVPRKPPAAPKPARKPAMAAPAPVAEVPVAPAPAPAAAPEPPAPPPDPQSQCSGRNFIARAQCMAAQCLKPEFQAHAQCEAVRRQQRLDEEKRNPTMAN